MSGEDLIAAAGSRAEAHGALGARTTYRVGGTATVVLEIGTLADLADLSPAIRASGLPVVVVGNGSNLLVADGEIECCAIVLGEGFRTLRWGDVGEVVHVELGAALDLPVAARRLADAGVVGFEWAVGIPGTVGGACAMNAGGHGGDMAQVTERVDVWSLRRDEPEEVPAAQMAFGYRRSALGPDEVVIGATLRLKHGDVAGAKERVKEIVRWRREHQPGGQNAGSVFSNPPGHFAGELIERAGCKGRRHGGAVVSVKHANFVIAEEGATSSDVLALMIEVRAAVESTCGVRLQSEVRTLGFGGRWP